MARSSAGCAVKSMVKNDTFDESYDVLRGTTDPKAPKGFFANH